MARGGTNRRYTAEEAQKAGDWFKQSGSSTENLAKWDVKEGLLSSALFGLLASGRAIMFGTAGSGAAISLTIFDGDDKHRVWVTDVVELEDALLAIQTRLQPEVAIERPEK